VVHTIETLDTGHEDGVALLELAQSEDDQETADEVASDIEKLIAQLETLEFRRMFAGEMDPNNAFLDIQAGSGRHRGSGLGRNAATHVPSMGRK
jgi:peptide chain release factor 2